MTTTAPAPPVSLDPARNPTRGPTRRPLDSVLEFDPAEAADRKIRHRVQLAWGLLALNTLTFYPRTWSGAPLLLPIPSSVGKLMTQGALPLALLVALSINRRIAIRPNVFLCLVGLLAVEALMNTVQAEHFGSVYRPFRLIAFLVTLWLLTPWWGRRDMLLIRCHLRVAYGVLGLMLAGLVLSPGTALAQGRLAGVIWPTPPTQVAEFAAVTTGMILVLWLGGQISGRFALPVIAISIVALLLTHTRTALVAMIGAILVAGLSMFSGRARVRRLFTITSVVGTVGAISLSGFLTNWLARGESTKELTDLTGRTTVWAGVENMPRTRFQDIFGFGLSNKSFQGLPIDSNWLASYLDQGLFGVAVSAAILVFLLMTAFFQPRGVQRALGMFLTTYCLAASFTETGFSDASTYMLYVALAASLLISTRTDSKSA
jgi:hypothetical protein